MNIFQGRPGLLLPCSSIGSLGSGKLTDHIQQVAANMQGRDFICGDLHGQLEQLHEAMNAVNFDTAVDRLFVLGDLIDRGERSREAFELLREPWFLSIRGNHEALMFDAYRSRSAKDTATWLNNGGRFWAADTDKLFHDADFTQLLEAQMQTMPWAIELKLRDGRKIGLIHAECPVADWHELASNIADPGIDGNLCRYNAIWSRDIRAGAYRGGVENIDLVVHGHCIFKRPVRHFNRCYLDTGAFLQSKHLFGMIRKSAGSLTVMQAETLFELPDMPWDQLKQLRR